MAQKRWKIRRSDTQANLVYVDERLLAVEKDGKVVMLGAEVSLDQAEQFAWAIVSIFRRNKSWQGT